MKTLLAAIALTLVIAAPGGKPVRLFIEVVDSFDEAPGWALYPIDAIYGSAVQARYSGSESALFTCPDWSERVILTGEGGGLSVDVHPDYPYVAGTYAFCHVALLGKRDRVLATDAFTIYSPV